MAFEHRQIIEAQYQHLANERAAAVAEYENGRISEDSYATMSAAERILEADQKRAALDRIAQTFVASQQRQPQGNKHGLSDEEIEVAKNWTCGGTADQRIDEYARNKQRYQQLRANGRYRDDQGKVTK